MTRSLFVAMFVLVSTQAQAQATDACKIGFGGNFFKPASVALEYLTTVCDYKVDYSDSNDVPGQLVNLDGKTFTSVNEAVSEIVFGIPYAATVDPTTRTIVVRRQGLLGTTGSSRLAPSNVPSAVVSAPAPFDPDAEARATSERIQRQILGDSAYEAGLAQNRRPIFISRPTPAFVDGAVPNDDPYIISQQMHLKMLGPAAYANGLAQNYNYGNYGYGSAGSYGNYGGYGGGYADHSYVQAMIDQDTWGALKFKKGRETVMKKIEIYGCGQVITQADEANSFLDHAVRVPVNCRPLTFRYTNDKEVDMEVEMDFMIVPMRIMKEKKVTLDDDFFKGARKRTEYLRYSMVEQPNGSFKKVPR